MNLNFSELAGTKTSPLVTYAEYIFLDYYKYLTERFRVAIMRIRYVVACPSSETDSREC